MRIEARDRDARMGDAECLRTGMGQPDRVHLRREIAFADRLGQRTMDGDEDRANVLVRQHHGDLGSAAMIGQDFGVAGIVQTGGGERFLVDRRRDDAAHPTVPRQSDRDNNGVERRASTDGRNLADRWQDTKLRGAKHVERSVLEHTLIKGSDRPDPHISIQRGKGMVHHQRITNDDPVPLVRATKIHFCDDLGADAGGITHGHGERSVMGGHGSEPFVKAVWPAGRGRHQGVPRVSRTLPPSWRW